MAANDGDERRKKTRIPRRLPVRFGTDAKMCGGTAVDISEGGLRIECTEGFAPHSVINVFVQFPRHAVRLKARVIWGGATKDGGSPIMGMAFTQPEPALARAYAEWCAEVKLAVHDSGPAPNPPAAGAQTREPQASSGHQGDAAAAAASTAPRPRAPEPRGPVRRRLESRQGGSFDGLFEKQAGGWQLTIVQVPRQIGIDAPDFQDRFDDFESAESSFRNYVRKR